MTIADNAQRSADRGIAPTPASVTSGVVAVTLLVAAGAWIATLRQMDGMNMGVATKLGSPASFEAVWMSMMAAMMLPPAVPAVRRRIATDGRAGSAPKFLATYLAVWAAVGLVVYVVYRPHGTVTAGAVAIAAGCYELTPTKRHFRRHCYESSGPGLSFGLACLASSIGLTLTLVYVGVMSVVWMVAISAIVIAQKLLPPKAVIDITVALAIIGLGVLILVAPSSLPGLTPHM